MAGGWGDDSSSSEDEGDAVVITAQQVQQVVNVSAETEQPISKPPPPPSPARQRNNHDHNRGGRGGRSHDNHRGGGSSWEGRGRGGGRHSNQGGGYAMKGAGGGNYRIVVENGDSKGSSNQNNNRRPAPSRNWKEEAKQSSILGKSNTDGQKLDGSAWMANRREKLKQQEAEERRRQEEIKEKQAEEARERRHSQMAALKQVVAKADASNSTTIQDHGKAGSHRKIQGLDDEEVSHDGSHRSQGSHWSKTSRGSAGGGARSDSWRRGMAPPGKDHTHRPQILQKPPASPKPHRKGGNPSPVSSPKPPSKTMATSSGVVGRHVITTGEGTKVEYKGGGSSLAMAVSNLKEGNRQNPKHNHSKPSIQRMSDGSVRISKDGGKRNQKGPQPKKDFVVEARGNQQTTEHKNTATEEKKIENIVDSTGTEEKVTVELSEVQEIRTKEKDDKRSPNVDEESSVGSRSFSSAGGRSGGGRSKRGRGGRGRSGRGVRASGRGRDGRDGSGRGRDSSGRGRGAGRGKGKSNYRAPRPAGPNAKSHSYHIEIGGKPS